MRKNPPIPSENLNDLHDIMTFMTHHVFGNLTGTCPLSDSEVYGSGVTDNHNNDIDFTLANPSGESLCNGCQFYLHQGGTVRLNGINAIWSDDSYSFIYCESDLTIDITGNNSISCPLYGYTIDAYGTLKLRGNGTLTVTGNEDGSYGLCGEVNYNYSDGLDVSKLAAPGYTVTRSATTDNGDGTFTWTYTVAPQ